MNRVCLAKGNKGMKNTSLLPLQLTPFGGHNSRDIDQGLSIFCYLGHCIYSSAGWLREFLLEICDGWPGFIHGQM